MLVLGKNRHVEKEDLKNILRGIANKLTHSTNWVYIHGEDDRLTSAVMEILKRNLLKVDEVKVWIESLTKPADPWVGAWMDEERTRAFGNVRNFLRSLLLNILSSNDLSGKVELQTLIMDVTTALVPY